MTQFPIDENVPLITTTKASQKYARYPFEQMEVGDSFFVPDDKDERAAAEHAHNYAKMRSCKFSTRKVPGGRRIWRVK